MADSRYRNKLKSAIAEAVSLKVVPVKVSLSPAKVFPHPSVPQKIEESLEQENESDPSDSTEPQPSLSEQLRARHDLFVEHCSKDYRIRL